VIIHVFRPKLVRGLDVLDEDMCVLGGRFKDSNGIVQGMEQVMHR